MILKLTIAVFVVCQCCYVLVAQDGSKILTQQEFLCQLLNQGNAASAVSLASNFAFTDSIAANVVDIIQYKKNEKKIINLGNFDATINHQQKIVIIIHGFQSSGSADWVKKMVQAYHKNGIKNTLAVDWNSTASTGYLKAASAVRKIGEMVAEWLVNNLLRKNPKNLANVHLVGHSLGAHISGFIGKRVFNLTRKIKIGRISGLDVAAPLFEYPLKLPSTRRLNDKDAVQVDAYHTNVNYFGFLSSLGKHDFYINYGGPIQPPCKRASTFLKSIQCSHSSSHLVFTKTINSKDYIANQCRSTPLAKSGKCDNNLGIIMGDYINGTYHRGRFYENTNNDFDPI